MLKRIYFYMILLLVFPVCLAQEATSDQILMEGISKAKEVLDKFEEDEVELNTLRSDMIRKKLYFSELIGDVAANTIDDQTLKQKQQELIDTTKFAQEKLIKLKENGASLQQFISAREQTQRSYEEVLKEDLVPKGAYTDVRRHKEAIAQLHKKNKKIQDLIVSYNDYVTMLQSWQSDLLMNRKKSASKDIINFEREKAIFSVEELHIIWKSIIEVPQLFQNLFSQINIFKHGNTSQLVTFFIGLIVLSSLGLSSLYFFRHKKKQWLLKLDKTELLFFTFAYVLLKRSYLIIFVFFYSLLSVLFVVIFPNITMAIPAIFWAVVISFSLWKIGMTFISVCFFESIGFQIPLHQELALFTGKRIKQIITILSLSLLFSLPSLLLHYENPFIKTILYFTDTLLLCCAFSILWKIDLSDLLKNSTKKIRYIAHITRAIFGIMILLTFVALLLRGFGFISLSTKLIGIFSSNFIVIILSWVTYIVSHELIDLFIKYIEEKNWIQIPKHNLIVKRLIKTTFNTIIIVAGLILFIYVWARQIYLTTDVFSIHLMQIGEFTFQIHQLIKLTIVYLLFSWIFFIMGYMGDMPTFLSERFDEKLQANFLSIIKYVMFFIAILISASILGFTYKNVAIIAGALSVGIGFGLQNIVNNFVSGLIMLFEQPIRVGDHILVDGMFAQVVRIGIRSTLVTSIDNSSIIIPNSEIISNKVTNWTLSDSKMVVTIDIGVAYGTDTRMVQDLLLQILSSQPLVLKDPEPLVFFTNFSTSSLDFRLRFWVNDLNLRGTIKTAIRHSILEEFAKHQIVIPFPQQDVHIIPSGNDYRS